MMVSFICHRSGKQAGYPPINSSVNPKGMICEGERQMTFGWTALPGPRTGAGIP